MRYEGAGFVGFAIVVQAAGPAAAAGLREGDEIVGLDGVALRPGDVLTEHLPKGTSFGLRVRRAVWPEPEAEL